MSKYRIRIQIEYYLDEIIEAEDELDAQEKAEEYKSDAIEHASEDVHMDVECLNCDEDD